MDCMEVGQSQASEQKQFLYRMNYAFRNLFHIYLDLITDFREDVI